MSNISIAVFEIVLSFGFIECYISWTCDWAISNIILLVAFRVGILDVLYEILDFMFIFCPSGTFRFVERMECFIFWISCQSEYFFTVFCLNCHLFSILKCCLFASCPITHYSNTLQAILPYSQALEKFAPHIQQASPPELSIFFFFFCPLLNRK